MWKRTKTTRAIRSAVGKAINRYAMIADGDRIVVGLSGGKDSLTLLSALQEMLSRAPVSFELFPVYVDPGFGGGFSDALKSYCDRCGINLTVDHTDHGVVAHGSENRKNPCFLCSMMRRKRLFEIADDLGCSKVALGHNMDDIIETFFLNMFHSGQISTMVPSQSLFDGQLMIIRPLAFLDEKIIIRFAKSLGLPEFENPCPSAGFTRREDVKAFLNGVYAENSHTKSNIFKSLSNIKPEYMLQ